MARKPVNLMRKKNLLGPMFGKYANLTTSLMKSVGNFYDIGGAGHNQTLRMHSGTVDDTTVLIKFSQNAFFTEATLPNGMVITNTTTAEEAIILASTGSGTGQATYTVDWGGFPPAFGDLLNIEYGGFGLQWNGEVKARVASLYEIDSSMRVTFIIRFNQAASNQAIYTSHDATHRLLVSSDGFLRWVYLSDSHDWAPTTNVVDGKYHKFVIEVNNDTGDLTWDLDDGAETHLTPFISTGYHRIESVGFRSESGAQLLFSDLAFLGFEDLVVPDNDRSWTFNSRSLVAEPSDNQPANPDYDLNYTAINASNWQGDYRDADSVPMEEHDISLVNLAAQAT